jgi:hypothetical protein
MEAKPMRPSRRTSTLCTLLAVLPAAPLAAQDADRSVADGGIHVDGWMGRVDARAAADGMSVTDTRLARDGDGLVVTTGPATTYWSPANRATGEYTVTATFTESEYMALNNHPHPYGIVIAGNDMGTENESYLYCATYGNGSFILRGFGPEPFQVNGRRPERHDAINVAAGQGEPVTQEIALSVRADRIECAVNGTVVGSYARSEVVADGRLRSTDGVYGLRFAHNTEATVTGLRLTRH